MNAISKNPIDYSNEPEWPKVLKVNSDKPYNAEAPTELLVKTRITPVDLFLKRNHGPVPDIDEDTYSLTITGLVEKEVSLTMKDIRTLFKTYSVEAVMNCAGNRRGEMDKIAPVDGVFWGAGALGNAVWEGVSLADVLEYVGSKENAQHIEFIGCDIDHKLKTPYGVSIPIEKAMSKEVLLAFGMNGEPLKREHGFPLRVVVPGFIGARSVKWLTKIVVREDESDNFYQKNDYKLFLPKLKKSDITEKDWEKAVSITELNLNSVIGNLKENQEICDFPYTVKGYAYSNGSQVWRVDYSLDDGLTWGEAVISSQQNKQPYGKYFGMVLWEFEIKEPFKETEVTVRVKAYDRNSNTQPEDTSSLWNFRGVMNNAQSRVTVRLQKGVKARF